MKVWISKYALTTGIFERQVKVCDGNPDMVETMMDKSFQSYFHVGEWHTTKAEAILKAEDMRQRKIASLKKQLAKLETMTF